MHLVGHTRNMSLLSLPKFHRFLLFCQRQGTQRPLSFLRIIIRWLEGFLQLLFLLGWEVWVDLVGQEGLICLWGCFLIWKVHLWVVWEDLVGPAVQGVLANCCYQAVLILLEVQVVLASLLGLVAARLQVEACAMTVGAKVVCRTIQLIWLASGD